MSGIEQYEELRVFGLTEDEAAQLESDDKEFDGFSERLSLSLPFQPVLGLSASDGNPSDTNSEGEELGDRGILPEHELLDRIATVASARGG